MVISNIGEHLGRIEHSIFALQQEHNRFPSQLDTRISHLLLAQERYFYYIDRLGASTFKMFSNQHFQGGQAHPPFLQPPIYPTTLLAYQDLSSEDDDQLWAGKSLSFSLCNSCFFYNFPMYSYFSPICVIFVKY